MDAPRQHPPPQSDLCVLAADGQPRGSRSGPGGSFLVYSITKTFIAALALREVERGRLALDAPLGGLPAPLQGVTLRHLLAHTSGLPDYGGLPAYHRAVREHPGRPWSRGKFLQSVLGQPLLFAPGQGWSYANVGFMLARERLEQAADRSFADLLSEGICRPLGLDRTRVVTRPVDMAALVPGATRAVTAAQDATDVRAHYHPGWVSHGVIASTAEEVARFVHALLGAQLVSAASLQEITRLVRVPGTHPGWCEPSYGLGLMGDPAAPGGPLLAHSGGGPGYSASVFARLQDGRVTAVACALCAGEETSAEALVLHELQDSAAGRTAD